jgi:DNA-binding protein HU-beta
MLAMTRADLVARMAKASGWSKAATERGVRAMLAGMLTALKRGEAVTLVGFGTLTTARRKPRTIANPRTGKAVTVSGRVPRFKPSKELKQAVR